jgi:hypothetical protein
VGAAAIFLGWHHAAVGWTGHAPDSTWAPAFQRVDFWGGVRNAAIVGWRMLDFGRVVEWAALVFLGGRFFWSGRSRVEGGRFFGVEGEGIWGLLICCAVCLLPTALLYQNLSAHRYFLPLFGALHWLTLGLVSRVEFDFLKKINPLRGMTREGVFFLFLKKNNGDVGAFFSKKILLTLLVVGLASGNFWVYPTPTSTGWDGTLLHLAYHPLRAEAVAWLDAQGVDFQEIGTCFPNINTGEHLLLDGDQRRMAPLDLERQTWVVASNVYNDLNAAEYAALERDYRVVWTREHAGVWVRVYRRKGD